MTNAKANPGDLTGSGTAQGGIWHLALVGFLNVEGMTPDAIRWVPSDGAASTMQELVTGGVDVATGHPRFTFGQMDLLDGDSFIPAMTGMFALSQVICIVAAIVPATLGITTLMLWSYLILSAFRRSRRAAALNADQGG